MFKKPEDGKELSNGKKLYNFLIVAVKFMTNLIFLSSISKTNKKLKFISKLAVEKDVKKYCEKQIWLNKLFVLSARISVVALIFIAVTVVKNDNIVREDLLKHKNTIASYLSTISFDEMLSNPEIAFLNTFDALFIVNLREETGNKIITLMTFFIVTSLLIVIFGIVCIKLHPIVVYTNLLKDDLIKTGAYKPDEEGPIEDAMILWTPTGVLFDLINMTDSEVINNKHIWNILNLVPGKEAVVSEDSRTVFFVPDQFILKSIYKYEIGEK